MVLVLTYPIHLLLRLLGLEALDLFYHSLVLILLLLLLGLLERILFLYLSILEEFRLHLLPLLGHLPMSLLLLGRALGGIGHYILAKSPSVLLPLVLNGEGLYDLRDVGFLLLVVLERFILFCLVDV